VRLWISHGDAWGYWQDSKTYVDASRVPLLSLAFWAGPRAPAVPLLLKLTGENFLTFVHVQIWVSIACWGFLAFAAGRCVEPGWRRFVASGSLLAFALTRPVSQWDRQILSESMSLSFLALAMATSLLYARRRTWPRAAAVVVAATAWIACRDTHALLVGLAGIGAFAVAFVFSWRREFDARSLSLGLALLVVAGLGQFSADHGDREVLPLADVFAVRILPFPERLDWFADRGMPQADRLRSLAQSARQQSDTGAVVIDAYGSNQPALRAYYRWLGGAGQRLYIEYLATHPRFLLFEPFADPPHVFNEPGRWSFYGSGTKVVPGLAALLFPPWPAALAELLVAIAAATTIVRRRVAPGLWWVTMGWAGIAVIHLLASWHGSGQEAARHALLPDVQFRAATLVALILVIASASGCARKRPVSSSHGASD
jgi:hypothetical protein